MNGFLGRRKLSAAPTVTGATVINKLRSLYKDPVKPWGPHPIVQTALKKESETKKLKDDTPIIPNHTYNPIPGKLRRVRRSLQDVPVPPYDLPPPPPLITGPQAPPPPLAVGNPLPPLLPNTPTSFDEKTRDNHHDGHWDRDHNRDRNPNPHPGDKKDADNHGPWNPAKVGDAKDPNPKPAKDDHDKGKHGWFFGGSDSDSDSDGEDEDGDRPPRSPRHWGPKLPEDTMFAGALGFGAEGDMCLYQNLDRLSDPCVRAVSDLYSLRSQYWAAEMTPPPPRPCHSGLLLAALAILGLFLLVKKLRWRKRREQVNAFLAAVAARPELKAAVEEQTQLKVPEPLGCKGCSCGALLKRVCKSALFGVVVLGASFAIAVSSLEVTAHIIHHIDRSGGEEGGQGEGAGEGPGPVSALAALMILTAVCAIHVTLFFLLIRLGKFLYIRSAEKTLSFLFSFCSYDCFPLL